MMDRELKSPTPNHSGAQKLTMLIITLGVLLFLPHFAHAQAAREYKDIVYARIGDKNLGLDLYMPAGVSTPWLLVWVHGGAWRSGSKAQFPKAFVENGIAVASLDFRLSTEARFPAAIHDIKAAIRFLRAKASEYGYRSDRIAIAGASSGGHLAALVGVTNGNKDLEGTMGDFLDYPSDVQAIVSYFGASNLNTILAQSTPHGLNVRKPALELLLGSLPENAEELAKMASPVFHVDQNDPPLLSIHGDQDPQMPINQAHELVGMYKKNHLEFYFEVVYGGGHGGEIFFSGDPLEQALSFLRRILDRK